jgi:hypothetical protein
MLVFATTYSPMGYFTVGAHLCVRPVPNGTFGSVRPRPGQTHGSAPTGFILRGGEVVCL